MLQRALSGFLYLGFLRLFVFFGFVCFLLLPPLRITELRITIEENKRTRELETGDAGKSISLFLLCFPILPHHAHSHTHTHRCTQTSGQISKSLLTQQTNHKTLTKENQESQLWEWRFPPFLNHCWSLNEASALPGTSSGSRTPRLCSVPQSADLGLMLNYSLKRERAQGADDHRLYIPPRQQCK